MRSVAFNSSNIDVMQMLQRRVSVAHIFGSVLKKSVLESISDLEYVPLRF